MKYDAIIIGGGHNGLVTACYLARAKWKVLVLERRYIVGGACVTEEVFPGFKVSTAAYVNSLFRPEIIRDLHLNDYGFEVIERNPSSFSPFLDGRYLMLGAGLPKDVEEIAKFSRRDAENYPKYEAMLERVASVVEPTLMQVPPNIIHPRLGDLLEAGKMARALQRLGPGMGEAIEVLTGAARPILDRWFESEQLKGTLATDAIIGAFMAPSMPGTAYVLFHHVMGETNGKRGVWGYVRGGMGGLTQALARAAEALGVEIRTNAEVAKITTRRGRVTGVALANGDEFRAKRVASNVDCHLTFEKLLDPKYSRRTFARPSRASPTAARRAKSTSHWNGCRALPRCPDTTPDRSISAPFTSVPIRTSSSAPTTTPSTARSRASPIVECTMPSSLDSTVAPPGKHLMSMFVQYAPYKLKDGPWTDALRNEFADRCFDVVERYAPDFKASVIDRQMLTPVDLEEKFGLTGGNIFQGAMPLHQLFAFRPVPGFAGYSTPVRGLYLCGAAAHPGGGVMGASGWNAARVMLRGR